MNIVLLKNLGVKSLNLNIRTPLSEQYLLWERQELKIPKKVNKVAPLMPWLHNLPFLVS